MEAAYAIDWLNLLLRWGHVIAGIAWIGSSFYFIWLDLRLNVPPRNPENEDVGGDLWAVHGGGFYHAQKYRVAPATAFHASETRPSPSPVTRSPPGAAGGAKSPAPT